jgi:hypothetical protein
MAQSDAALVIVGIGGKGSMTSATIQRMKDAPRTLLHLNPLAELLLCVDGYDNDARSLWDIPEVADYIRRYARAAGLNDWTGRLFKRLDEGSKALLIACDAIDRPHPFKLDICGDP